MTTKPTDTEIANAARKLARRRRAREEAEELLRCAHEAVIAQRETLNELLKADGDD